MESNIQNDKVIKLLILGESLVGKTCMLVRYTNNEFNINTLATAGIDYKIKNIELEGKRLKLYIYDTAGQERFRTITRNFYKGAQGIILTYDITDEKTFHKINHWSNEIRQHAQKNVSLILVGNKADKQGRQVTFEQGQNLANELKVDYIETSALEGKNINLMFEMLVKEVLKNNPSNDSQPAKIDLKNKESSKTNGDCGC